MWYSFYANSSCLVISIVNYFSWLHHTFNFGTIKILECPIASLLSFLVHEMYTCQVRLLIFERRCKLKHMFTMSNKQIIMFTKASYSPIHICQESKTYPSVETNRDTQKQIHFFQHYKFSVHNLLKFKNAIYHGYCSSLLIYI